MRANVASNERIPAHVVVLFWAAVASFFVTQNVSARLAASQPVHWRADVGNELLYWLMWVIVSPIIIRAFQEFPFDRANRFSTILKHIAAAIVVALLQVGAYLLVYVGPVRSAFVVFLLMTAVWKYWVVIALLMSWWYARLYRDASAQLEHAQLERLKSQLQPHFLFNTLNSISVLVADAPAVAQRMIGQLSELLRIAIDTNEAQLVTLREEMEFTQRYVAIQQLRFGDRLTVDVDVSDAAYRATLPHLILQPLVENAILHGLSSEKGGQVVISGRVADDDLIVTVTDSGSGETDTPAGNGIGLKNARQRLEWLYGNSAELALTRSGSGSVVTLRIPQKQSL